MIDRNTLRDWVNLLSQDSEVAIDDGGLTLIEINDGAPTGTYLEIGGVPLSDEYRSESYRSESS